jgi:outer membrane receptor protein involved in Fe transport
VGCRYEFTQTDLSFSTLQGISIKPYSTLIPSAAISKSLKKNQSIKLNYSRRISRPSYRDLNPFINATDPKNLSTGNPALDPEYSHNGELSYTRFFDKGSSFNAAAFFRGNFQDIQPYSTYYSSFQVGDSIYKDVTVSRRANIGTEYNTGLNLFVNLKISKILSVRSNASLFQRYIYSIYKDGNIQGFMYRINATLSCQLTDLWAAEMFGNFNSPRINVQGVQPTFTTYNVALRRLSKNKKASLAITAINPFAKYVKQKTELNGSNFNSYSVLQLPYRSFGINFTYKFGKMEFKKQKQLEDENLTNPSAPGN